MYYREKSAIFIACECGHLRIVKLLVEHGADVNYCHPVYGTLVQIVAANRYLELLDYLVSFGANIDLEEIIEDRKEENQSLSFGIDLSNKIIDDSVYNVKKNFVFQKSALNHAINQCHRNDHSSSFVGEVSLLIICEYLLNQGSNLEAKDMVIILCQSDLFLPH